MEVKAGYKQTEVGVIPDDWEVKSLDAISFVTSGKRLPLGKSLTDNETPHPYIRVTDMRQGTVELSDIKFVPADVFPSIKRYRIFKDDIFISVAGTLGIVGKIPLELDGANLTENADRITNIACSRDYLLHFLMSPVIRNTIEAIQTVGAQPKLALTRIRKFDIPVPPTLAEQKAIAETLSDADAFIEALEQLLAKKRQVKQGAMQELLAGKKRLPGFSGEHEFVKLGLISFITDFSANGSFADLRENVKYLSNPDYAILVRLADFSRNWSEDFVYIPKHSYNFLKKCQLDIGDVIIANIGANAGTLFQVPNLGKPMALGPNALVIKTNDFPNTSKEYLYCYLGSPNGQKQIQNIIASSAQPKFNKTDIRSLVIPLPTLQEQTAIAEILSDIDAEIAALEGKLSKARQVKQGMMQELLTGRVRLV